MDSGEVAAKGAEVQAQLRKGSITEKQYLALINQLRVQDTRGTWWQPDPSGSGWIFWDGANWQPGILPSPKSFGYAAADTQAAVATTQDFSGFREGIMDKETYSQISRNVPWKKRPQKWWDRFSIMLGIIMAVVWFLYASLTPVISLLTTGYMSEEFDLLSSLLMVAMPLFLIWKRREIDNLLMPLQPSRNKVSRKMLIGMGIAIPFLTAFVIYHFFQISQYPLMHWNIVIGTMVSYALVREPVLADQYRGNPGTGTVPDFRIILLIAGFSFCIQGVLADHCLKDPLNARDCMRTTGTAELLAGGVSAGVSGAVNGPTMMQSLSGDVSGGEPGGGGSPELFPGGENGGGPSDNPFTEYCGGHGPGGCL